MGSNKLVKGHAFNFETDICARCGMTRRQYEDAGEPNCTGKRREAEQGAGERKGFVRDDDA
jgi:hypothetical protein